MKRLLAALSAVAAAALVTPTPAAASPTSELAYLQRLTDFGLVVYDPARVVDTGYRICRELEHRSGEAVAWDLFGNTSWSDVPTPESAAKWVVAAAETLCPWNDHRGRVA